MRSATMLVKQDRGVHTRTVVVAGRVNAHPTYTWVVLERGGLVPHRFHQHLHGGEVGVGRVALGHLTPSDTQGPDVRLEHTTTHSVGQVKSL